MEISLKTDLVWVKNSLNDAQTAALVNIVGGDGAKVKVPRDLLVASSTFLQNLLPSSCSTCLGSTTIFLPSVQRSTLELFSQILFKGETVALSGNVIGDSLDKLKYGLNLLGCDGQLVVSKLSRSSHGGDLRVSRVESLLVDLTDDSDNVKMEQNVEDYSQEDMTEQASLGDMLVGHASQGEVLRQSFQEDKIVPPPCKGVLANVISRSKSEAEDCSGTMTEETVLGMNEEELSDDELQDLHANCQLEKPSNKSKVIEFHHVMGDGSKSRKSVPPLVESESPSLAKPDLIIPLEKTPATEPEDLVETALAIVVKKLTQKNKESIKMKCLRGGNKENLSGGGYAKTKSNCSKLTGLNNNLQTSLNEAFLNGNKVLKFVKESPKIKDVVKQRNSKRPRETEDRNNSCAKSHENEHVNSIPGTKGDEGVDDESEEVIITEM